MAPRRPEDLVIPDARQSFVGMPIVTRRSVSRACHPGIPKPLSKRLRTYTGKRPGNPGGGHGQPMPEGLDFPSVEDGVEGVAFSRRFRAPKAGVWTKMQTI